MMRQAIYQGSATTPRRKSRGARGDNRRPGVAAKKTKGQLAADPSSRTSRTSELLDGGVAADGHRNSLVTGSRVRGRGIVVSISTVHRFPRPRRRCAGCAGTGKRNGETGGRPDRDFRRCGIGNEVHSSDLRRTHLRATRATLNNVKVTVV